MTTNYIELRFTLPSGLGHGNCLPVDHGYALYAAVSRHLAWVHGDPDIGIAPVRGLYLGGGELLLQPWSRLVIRAPTDKLPGLLPLAGRTLDVDGHRLRIGAPTVHALTPAATLYAHIVTTKHGDDAERFDVEIARQMAALGVTGRVTRQTRRTARIRDKQVVGYTLLVAELEAEASLTLQAFGLGGRRKMGCGVFAPTREGWKQ